LGDRLSSAIKKQIRLSKLNVGISRLEIRMKHFKFFTFLFLYIFPVIAIAAPLSDSLPIQGHYSQGGRTVSRFKLERFLLDKSPSSDFVDHSLGYKWSGHGIGALLWSVNIGMTVYEVMQIMDAIEKQKIVIDTANGGLREPFSNKLARFTIPLTIGSQAATFIQTRLYNRSDYLLHKGALAFNMALAKKYSEELDLHIEKKGFGVYVQGGLVFYEPVLYSVLREQKAASNHVVWSWTLKETGIQLGAWGSTFLGYALISYLQETSGMRFAIDKKEQRVNLNLGIGLTVGSLACAIASAVVRNKGIERYNEALSRQKAAAVQEQQKNIDEKPVPPVDSTASGINESK
jgi:hypothetical protein